MTEQRPAFRDQLAALEAAGARQRDPVRFRYLQSLTGRLADSRHPSHHKKLQNALDDFQKTIARKELEPLPSEEAISCSPLHALLERLQTANGGAEETDDDDPLALLIQQQKHQLKSGNPTAEPPLRDLKAIRHLRATRARLHTETRIERAIAAAPGDAGPLNAHRLVTRALERMRDLSPAYLHRFASHLEILMELERIK